VILKGRDLLHFRNEPASFFSRSSEDGKKSNLHGTPSDGYSFFSTDLPAQDDHEFPSSIIPFLLAVIGIVLQLF